MMNRAFQCNYGISAIIPPALYLSLIHIYWAWIDAGGRATPSYLSGHGVKGSPYILWVRRNAAESAYSTAISGSWSPDEY